MSSTNRVPETRTMAGEELSADDAWHTLREYGRWHLARDAFTRFRYGDGFSHSRALALQLCLAVVPFLIALTGLAADLGQGESGEVIARTVLALTPGSSDAVVADVLGSGSDPGNAGSGSDGSGSRAGEEDEDDVTGEAGEIALVLGLLTGIGALTTAMAQIERGANRMYGVERDRPPLRKYGRALALALTAGLTAFGGFLLLVAGGPFGEAARDAYGWGEGAARTWAVLRWPLGLALTVASVALIFERAPRRRQPSVSWLAFGAGLSTLLWLAASAALALYVRSSGAFGDTYGPLTGIMALLLWANVTAVALFLGLAFAAQLEALRAGLPDPGEPDRWHPEPDLPRSGRPYVGRRDAGNG